MTEPTNRPKLAHETLADAVDLLLNGQRRVLQTPQDVDAQAEQFANQLNHLELALRNYRLAASAAASAPFAGIVNGAIAKLKEGDSEAAMKFLLTLVNVTDYSPTIALDQVAPKPQAEPEVTAKVWRPTHRHVDGGEYAYIGSGWHKDEATGEWQAAEFYEDAELRLRSTSPTRWLSRFQLILKDDAVG